MAVAALRGRADVVRRLPGRKPAVVAAGTGARHSAVIEYRIGKGRGGMTVVAVVATGNVVRAFSFGDPAIVAMRTSPDNREMINPGDGLPPIGGMAILALIRALDVV